MDLSHAATYLGVPGLSCISKLSTLNYKLLHSILHCITDDKNTSVNTVIVAYILQPTQSRRQSGLAPTKNKT